MVIMAQKPAGDAHEANRKLFAGMCRMLHEADNDVERLDIVQHLERGEIAPAIKRAKAIAREWDLHVFAGIHGRELKLAFIRRIDRD